MTAGGLPPWLPAPRPAVLLASLRAATIAEAAAPDGTADGTAARGADITPPRSTSPREGEVCLACGQPVREGQGLAITYRGRQVALHRGACLETWNLHREALFASLQPRGALFQEPAESPSPLKDAWFLFGAYVVVGLVAGAACAYLAVGRGLAPIPWFFAGLAGNVIALAAVLTRPRADLSRFPAGIPPGLAKVPTTLSPRSCPACGAENHPAAGKCIDCGGPLEPAAEPETARA